MQSYNQILIGFLCLIGINALVRFVLNRLNIGHLKAHGHEVPGVFADEIDSETLSKMNEYTMVNSRMASVEDLCEDLFIVLIVLTGFLPGLAGLIESYGLHFIVSGLLFLLAASFVMSLIGIPFDLYRNFVIEKRFSFNNMTLSIWLSDLFKGIVVSGILMGVFIALFLSIVHYAPDMWWLFVSIFFILFQLFVMWLYPVVIAPLFNKFEPIEDVEVRQGIISLMNSAGLNVKGLYKMDAGKRSRHSNAYFTGIGKSKRIVLYDTLLETHKPDEIAAVLAHELGHWKRGHIKKQLALLSLTSILFMYITFVLVNWSGLYIGFGFEKVILYAGLFLVTLAARPVFFFLTPFSCILSRHFERQADEYAAILQAKPESLVLALKHLAKENLANLHPHPLYAWFYYSHPPITERIKEILGRDVTGKT